MYNIVISSDLRNIYKPELESVDDVMLNMYAQLGISYNLFTGMYTYG